MTRIKICCIKDLDEAKLAIDMGISSLGLVSEMPSGPGVISMDTIAKIVKGLPPYITSNLLTSKTSSDEIIEQLLLSNCNSLQIVDRVDESIYSSIRKSFPALKIIQVIHVNNESSIGEAEKVSKFVDAILLDSGNQVAEIKLLGGTGKVHDWQISKKIKDTISVPLILAGGLNPENVTRAIDIVKPFAVDVCSGVRTDGSLDRIKLLKFIEAVNEKS